MDTVLEHKSKYTNRGVKKLKVVLIVSPVFVAAALKPLISNSEKKRVKVFKRRNIGYNTSRKVKF